MASEQSLGILALKTDDKLAKGSFKRNGFRIYPLKYDFEEKQSAYT